MFKKIIILILGIFALTSTSKRYIHIIRHGEKLKDRDFGLSPIGVKHAECLAGYYFHNFPTGRPDFAISKMSPTERPVETMNIIASKLNINSIHLSSHSKINEISSTILEKLNTHNSILIVWENTFIPKLAQKLGCVSCLAWNYEPTSKHHDAALFNSTWTLIYPNKKSYHISKVPDYNVEFMDYDQNFQQINGTWICVNPYTYFYREYKR